MEEKKKNNKKKTFTIIGIILLIILILLLVRSCSNGQKTDTDGKGGSEPTQEITDIKQDPTVKAPTANVLTYTGLQQELVKSGSTDGGTLQYKLDDGNYSTSIPVAVNAGTYTVYYKVVGDDEYNDVNEKSVTVTIDKAKIDVPTAKTALIYNGTEQTGVAMPSQAKYSIRGNTGTNASSAYSATVTLTDKTNYAWNLTTPTSDDQPISWSIAKKTITVTAADKESIVGSELVALTYTNDALCGSDSFTGALTTAANKDVVGAYDIEQGSLSAGGNYVISYVKATYTVKEIPVKSYSITNELYLCTADSNNATSINENGSVTLKYSKETGKDTYPKIMFVAGASFTYDSAKGELTISNPTDDVAIKDANFLTFTANTAQSTVTPGFMAGSYQYSTDNGRTWTDGDNNGTEIILTNAGDKVLLRGTDCKSGNVSGFLPFPMTKSFSMTGSIAASGDVTSLINGVGGDTTLSSYCCMNMFDGCTALTSAPQLPATTLAEYCYSNMFCNCTGLTSAPQLPATTLVKRCYESMFDGCTALTSAPQLPATTLAEYCYSYMFHGCTTLTSAPQLSATTLAESCYSNMFYDCVALTSAPQLSATTLAKCCYESMFLGCTALTTAPQLPATTLAESCYIYMFSGCTGLTSAPELKATQHYDENGDSVDGLAANCYQGMFYYCSSLASAPQLPATTLADACYNCMFYYCSSLTSAPQLPATTLTENCYSNMFSDCTGLTSAPEIKATSLADRSCYQMFLNCTSLKITTDSTKGTAFFTCPAPSGLYEPLSGMFTSTGGEFTDDPAAGNTYYWYTE